MDSKRILARGDSHVIVASFVFSGGENLRVGSVEIKQFNWGRKVRAPQGRVPDNVWVVRANGQCSREYTADDFFGRTGKGERVR